MHGVGTRTEEEVAYGEDPTTFPTDRCPEEFQKPLDVHTPDLVCEDWFQQSGITIGTHLMEEQRRATVRLLYTWKASFVSDTKDILATDLVSQPTMGFGPIEQGMYPIQRKKRRSSYLTCP